MPTKEERAELLSELEGYIKKLDTGRGLIVSSGYSNEHNALDTQAKVCKELLIRYADKDELTGKEAGVLKKAFKDLSDKSFAYIMEKKEQKRPYALFPSEDEIRDGIKRASGDKRTRLLAARDIRVMTSKFMDSLEDVAEAQEGKAGPEKEPDFVETSYKEFLRRAKIDPKQTDEYRETHAKGLVAKKEFEIAAVSLDTKRRTLQDVIVDINKMGSLHRTDLMKYKDDTELIEKYADSRLKIKEVVDSYNLMAMHREKAATDPTSRRLYGDFLKATFMCDEMFQDMREKVDTLELIGRHMDAKMNLITNKNYVRQRQGFDAFGASAKADMDTLAELEKLGISQDKPKTETKEVSYKKNEVKTESTTRTYKLLTAKGSYGKAAGGGVFNKPFMGKLRVAKISGKYASKHKHVTAGAHASAFGAKVNGSVNFGFSLKNPLDAQVGASIAASAYYGHGTLKAKVGNSDANINAKAEGSVGSVKGNAGLNLGHILYKDEDGKDVEGWGISANAGGKVAVLEGKLSGGVSFLGIKLSGKLEGDFISVGGKAKFEAMSSGFTMGLGGALGLGAGFEISVDWSGLKERVSKWRKNRKVSKAAADAFKKEGRDLEEQYEHLSHAGEDPDAVGDANSDSKEKSKAKPEKKRAGSHTRSSGGNVSDMTTTTTTTTTPRSDKKTNVSMMK